MDVLMFGQLINPCSTRIRATLECWWRSLVQLSLPSGPILSNHVGGTRFCPSWTRKMGDSTQVWSCHSSCHSPEPSLRASTSPNANRKHASRHLWTLHAPEVPRIVYLSTRVFWCACFSWGPLISMRCAFSFRTRVSGIPLAGFNSDHRLFVHGFAICNIW